MRRPAALLTACLVLTGCLDKTTSIIPEFDPTAPCAFTTRSDTMYVNASCTTTATIVIPDGMTLDGQGNTIHVVDPPGKHFLGAVIRNAGPRANVRKVVISGEALRDTGDAPPDDLAGIDFVNAGGNITDNVVRGIVQYDSPGIASGYQEGFAIRVVNLAVGGVPPAAREVTISGNTVDTYQKQGIFVLGDGVTLKATIADNILSGLGAQSLQAQYGIEISGVAEGTVTGNRVSGHIYTGPFPEWAGAIISDSGSNITFRNNTATASQMGIRLLKNRNSQLVSNDVTRSTTVPCGSWVVAGSGVPCSIGLWVHGSDNKVTGNRITDTDLGVKVGHGDGPPSHGKGPTDNTTLSSNRFTHVHLKMALEGVVTGTVETGSEVIP